MEEGGRGGGGVVDCEGWEGGGAMELAAAVEGRVGRREEGGCRGGGGMGEGCWEGMARGGGMERVAC